MESLVRANTSCDVILSDITYIFTINNLKIMIDAANRVNMMKKVTVDDIAQLDSSRIDFKNYDFGSITYTFIKENERARPDLLSLRIFGTPNYWWFIMWFNGFSDPWYDMMPDTLVKVPQLNRVTNAIKKYKTYA